MVWNQSGLFDLMETILMAFHISQYSCTGTCMLRGRNFHYTTDTVNSYMGDLSRKVKSTSKRVRLNWQVAYKDNRSRFGFMVFNTTFNNISAISWQQVLLVEETKVPGENHWPVASHWQTLSHNVVSSTPHLCRIWTHNVNGNMHWLHR